MLTTAGDTRSTMSANVPAAPMPELTISGATDEATTTGAGVETVDSATAGTPPPLQAKPKTAPAVAASAMAAELTSNTPRLALAAAGRVPGEATGST
jgi:hypothetical protein